MTAQRRDDHSTEFGLWMRRQPEIDSKIGYLATNIDYVWCSYKHPGWILLEEKRHCAGVPNWQSGIFQMLDAAARNDPNYRGFYVIRFENTSPEDGKVWLCHGDDAKIVTKDELTAFLRDVVKAEV